MYNDILTIGSFTIHGYGLMIAIGIIAAYAAAEYRGRRRDLDTNQIFNLTVIAVVFGLLGAKILYWLTILDEIMEDPSIMLNIGDGFLVYGGIVLGILAAWFWCRRKHIYLMEYLDVILPSVALGQGFGRIGCFLAGCCYGKETDAWFAITFTDSGFAPNGVALIPTQLMMSAFDFANFAVLCLISRKVRSRGIVTACYLFFFAVGKFVFDFFRGDVTQGTFGVFTTSQFFSFFMAGAAIIIYIVMRLRPLSLDEL